MSDKHLPIAVDALGGDHAPHEIVAGVVESQVPAILVGPENVLTRLLEESGSADNVEIVHADVGIASDDHPVQAYRTKKNASMFVATRLVKEGKAGGVVSAGNTGAFMMGATMMLGRLPEVSRPAAAITIPAPTGHVLLLDAGASTDCTSADLVNFGVMGSTFSNVIYKVKTPRIGMLSIGEEEMKGSKQAREAHQRLKASDLNFIGNVQGSDLASNIADVIVTDGFTGNVALKSAEGISMLIMEVVKDEIRIASGIQKAAAWLLLPLFKKIKKRLDWNEYGGGALLGVKGNVVIAHGKSKKRAISSAIKLACELAQTDLLNQLETALKEYHIENTESKWDESGDAKE